MNKNIGISINLKKKKAIEILNNFLEKTIDLPYHFIVQKSVANKIPDIPPNVSAREGNKVFSES